MKRYRLALFAATLIFANASALLAQDDGAPPADRRGSSVASDITPEAHRAIERGLEWLSRNQSPSGAYKYGGQDDVGITGLAGIALMAGGHMPGRGKYGRNVEGCVEYVLRNTNMTTGYINAGNSRMYQHAFAMLFLAEAFGMTHDARMRQALIKSVQLLQQSQNPEGGWRYSPTPTDADISVTICQIMALRAARNAGITVERTVINKAIEYVKSCHMNDGRFSYTAGGSALGSGFSSTAAGVATLFYAGDYTSREATRGLEWLLANHDKGFDNNHYPMYGNYYASQAMHLAPNRERYWTPYFNFVRNHLIQQQRPDGSWSFNHGEHYSTAMSLIILQVPNEYLPILQH